MYPTYSSIAPKEPPRSATRLIETENSCSSNNAADPPNTISSIGGAASSSSSGPSSSSSSSSSSAAVAPALGECPSSSQLEGSVDTYENLRPVWHDGMNAYVLHFEFDQHRVREKSVKFKKLQKSSSSAQ